MSGEEPRTVRLDADGYRTVEEHGETLADPVMPAELAVVEAGPRVTKTQARAAVNLRINGAGYDDIARVMNYANAAAARHVVEKALADAHPEESYEALRRLTGARMEGLMKKIAPKTEPTVPMLDEEGVVARNGKGEVIREHNPEQLAYVKAMADLITRHGRIMGVESTTVAITPTNEQYAATLRAALQQHNVGGAQEADPFAEEFLDAEVVEPEAGELDE